MSEKPEIGTMLSHQGDVEGAVEQILENLPTEIEEECDLPSRSKFYVLQDPSVGVSVRPMNFSDEKAIVQATNKDSINVLLSRCVSNIDINQLIQFDKLYLLMKVREVSFGSEYTVDLMCEACNIKNAVTFSLDSFKNKQIPEDLEDPREVTLEKIGKVAKVRFPRIQDEGYLGDSEKIMNNMWRFVMSIDGHENKAVISKVIQQLPSRDVHTLMNEIFGADYGLQTKGSFKCDGCGAVAVVELPIGTDFFTLS